MINEANIDAQIIITGGMKTKEVIDKLNAEKYGNIYFRNLKHENLRATLELIVAEIVKEDSPLKYGFTVYLRRPSPRTEPGRTPCTCCGGTGWAP